jgi:hypothetical protein
LTNDDLDRSPDRSSEPIQDDEARERTTALDPRNRTLTCTHPRRYLSLTQAGFPALPRQFAT